MLTADAVLRHPDIFPALFGITAVPGPADAAATGLFRIACAAGKVAGHA